MMKKPFASETADSRRPVSVLTASMVTPGRAALEESSTVPEIRLVVTSVWAKADPANPKRTNRAARAHTQRDLQKRTMKEALRWKCVSFEQSLCGEGRRPVSPAQPSCDRPVAI